MVSSTPVTTSHVDPTDPSKPFEGSTKFPHPCRYWTAHNVENIHWLIDHQYLSFLERCLTGHSPTSTQSPFKESSTRSQSMVRQRKFNNKDQKFKQSESNQWRLSTIQRSALVDKRSTTKDIQSKCSIQDISRSVPKSQVNQSSSLQRNRVYNSFSNFSFKPQSNCFISKSIQL